MQPKPAIAQTRPANRRERHKAAKTKRRKAANVRAVQSTLERNELNQLNLRLDSEESINQARAQLTDAVKQYPDNVQANLILGLIHSDKNDFDAAYPHLKKVVSIDPGNVHAWKGFANCLYNLNHFEAAVIAYREAAARKPCDPNILIHLGRTLSACGHSAEAMAAIDKALELAPD